MRSLESFWQNLENSIFNHEFSASLLTSEENELIDSFDKTFGEELEKLGENITPEEQADLAEKILTSIPGAREALNKYTTIVSSLDQKGKSSYFHIN